MSDPSSAGLFASLRRLYGHLSTRRRRQLVLVLVVMLAGAIAEIATLGAVLPFLALIADPGNAASYPALRNLFGALGWDGQQSILIPAGVMFACIALAAGGVRLVLAWISHKFIYRLGHDLGTEVYQRTLYQPYSYHVSKNTSEIIALIHKVQILTWSTLLQLLQAVISAVIGLFILFALVLIDARVAIGSAVLFGLFYIGVSRLTHHRLQNNGRVIAQAQARRIQTLQEGLGGIRDVILDEAQPVHVGKFRGVNLALHDAVAANAFISAAPRFVIEAGGMALIAGLALVLGSGSGGLATALPVLGAMAIGAQRLLPLMQNIYLGWSNVIGNRQVLSDVLETLDLPVSDRHSVGGDDRPLPFHDDIVLRNVSFRYGTDHPLVLDRINLRIRKGERIALVGATGSGKSTVTDLVMGLLVPTAGDVRIDGQPLTAGNIRGWQAQIAHVPQAIYLSDATIAENIAFGLEGDRIDMSKVRDAARRAEIASFVEGLSGGYDTVVGERGVRLSGGQRQRIGLARALYRRASVLVLDEATSALDNETEAAVMESIRGLDRNLTILIVAHRMTTIAFCDRVLRVNGGRIVEDGAVSAGAV